MKFSLLAIILLVATQLAVAQPRHGHGRIQHPPIERIVEHLSTELDLTDEQKTQLEAIVENYKPQVEALRTQVFDTREAKIAAHKALRKTIREEIEAVLTNEQLEELEALKAERGRRKNIDRQGLKTALKAYHKENIKPVLLTQRAKLEVILSEEDKATIAELRTFFKAKKQAMMQQRANGDRPRRDREVRSERPAEVETLKGLVEKYKEDIKSLMEEIEDQRKQWQEDRKVIREQFVEEIEDEDTEEIQDAERGRRHRARHQERRAMGPLPKAAHFLLLDPQQVNEDVSIGTLNTIATYPNPSSGVVTLKYEIKQAGTVRIDIQDDRGNIIQNIVNERKATGIYSANVNVSNLKSGAYYFTLSDAKGRVVQKVLIAQ